MKGYHKQFYANKFDNVYEIDSFKNTTYQN